MKKKKNKNTLIVISTILALLIVVGIVLFYLFWPRDDKGNPTMPELNNLDFISNVSENSNTVTITFPEGMTVTEIAQKLEENGVCQADAFLQAVQNPPQEMLEKFGIENQSERVFTLEGYIFPDTYEFYKDESVSSVISRFTDNFISKITTEDKVRAAELGYTMDEIITIASIIQEEAGAEEQNGKVSSVLHNRLKTGTKIECDVTITYLEEFCKPYLPDGLTEENKNNYNTYKCPALPKGPICNPGYASIKAALYPEDTDYLYFVTDADWNYYYAVTWDEHVANCNKAGIPGY